MPSSLEKYPNHVEFVLLHYENFVDEPVPLIAFLQALRSLAEPFGLTGKIITAPLNAFRERNLKPTETNWRKVISELRDGKLATLVFDLSLGGQDKFTVVCQLYNVKSNTSDTKFVQPDSISILTSTSTWVERDDVADLMMRMARLCWQTLPIANGLGEHFFQDYSNMLFSRDRIATVSRILKAFRQGPTGFNTNVDVLRFVALASWTNFLNREVVQGLGGYETLERSIRLYFPSANVEPLERDGAQITLSRSPILDNATDWELSHILLAQCLVPQVLLQETDSA